MAMTKEERIKRYPPVTFVCLHCGKTVPHTANCMPLIERYKALGGNVKLILKPGCDHHPHGLKDPTPTLEFIRAVYDSMGK